ncbi:hypothetical protein PHET_10173 [Paragonimus heterotremus]|uniref:SCP domain-containing protein n=1 Tax=Paragonimus heterotremus TaxID=100268 RepID=A0A8J4TAA6_9TREM|nr:hypothetical protein PHET_10173 [Paragonimus heterotremus]
MRELLNVIFLSTVAVEGKLAKHERDEVLRVHNELRQSIMNCEYGQFPSVRGQLLQLTWNYTLENMANIYARDAVGDYVDKRLIKEFIFNPSTYILENVEKFENLNFVLKDFVKTFNPLTPVHLKSFSAARKIASINITQVGCSCSSYHPDDNLKLLAVCYYNHPTGYFHTTLDYPVGDEHDCRRTGNKTNTSNNGPMFL